MIEIEQTGPEYAADELLSALKGVLASYLKLGSCAEDDSVVKDALKAFESAGLDSQDIMDEIKPDEMDM